MALMLIVMFSENAVVRFSCGASAPCYRGTEDVLVVTIVIAPLEFGDIQRQIFAADFVETAHDAALQERPETINRLSMDRAIDVLASAMPHDTMPFQLAISRMIISRDQANFFRNGFADEAVQSFNVGMVDDAGHDIALALDGADNSILAFPASSGRALVPMAVLFLAADIGFVNFDDAHEFAKIRIGQPGANAMAHIVCGRVGTKTKYPMYLQCGNAFLTGQHQIDDFEPGPHRDIGVFEDCSNQDRETIAERGTLAALPVEWTLRQFSEIFASTSRTTNPMRPTPRNEVGFTSIIRLEEPIELRDGHLFCELWAGHRSAPDV
jgi:hypothetical protein